jgi:hypothetical protein
MSLKAKFNRLQYGDILSDPLPLSPMPSVILKQVHKDCDAGPLLLDVASQLASYLAASVIEGEEAMQMINSANWSRETREAVIRAFVVELIERFVSGAPDTAPQLRQSSIAALACYAANQTDIKYYHDGA